MRFILSTVLFLTIFSAVGQGLSEVTSSKYNNVYGLIVGVSDYNEVKPLDYADNDADIMYRLLKKTFPGNDANLKLITNKDVTERSVKIGLNSMISKAQEGDLVVFYFSGHGDVVKDTSQNDIVGYFLMHDAPEDRWYDLGGGVEFEYVNNCINRITNDKKAEVWLMTDACKSGKVVDEDGAKEAMTTLNSSFSNTTKFISCGKTEFSFEDDKLEQGVFTYYLVKALSGEADTDDNKGALNVRELDTYMKDSVRAFTGKSQTPAVSSSDVYLDIITPQQDFLALIKDIKNIRKNEDLAINDSNKDNSKGFGGDKSKTRIALEDAILAGNLYGNSGSAMSIYESAKQNKSEEEELLKELLITALLERGQLNSNRFLSGKPMIGKNEDFKTTKKDYETVLKLIDSSDPMYISVQDRIAFFGAMMQIEQRENMGEAEKTLMSLSAKYPDGAHIHQGLAMLYLTQSDKTKAEAELKEAKNIVRSWSKPKNTEALIEIMSGNLEEANRLIEQAEGDQKDQNNVLLLKAKLHTANFELHKANQALAKIENSNKVDQATVNQMKGQVDELRGRIKVAEKYYTQALAQNGNDFELLVKLGELYKKNRDTTKALFYFNQARSVKPDDQGVKANLALLKGNVIEIDNQQIDVTNTDLVISVVHALEAQQKYDQAIALLDKTIEKVDWKPELYYELGKNKFSKGDQSGSITALKKALDVSPYHFESIVALTRIYMNDNQYQTAEGVIKKYDPYFQESAQWLTFCYRSYRKMGNSRDLFILLERALKLDSLETDVYRALYVLHLENQDFVNAKREYDELMRIGGGERDSLEFLYYTEIQVKDAIAKHNYSTVDVGLELLLKNDPMNLDFSYYMALTKYMQGDYEAADVQLRKFSKFLQTLSPGTQIEYYRLRGKVFLETGNYEQAERAFSLVNGSSGAKKCYLGMAMAQYELGKKEAWIRNFNRDNDLTDFNEDAFKRYQKMSKKAGKAVPQNYGGTQQNRGRY